MTDAQYEVFQKIRALAQEHFEGYALVVSFGFDPVTGLEDITVDGSGSGPGDVVELFEEGLATAEGLLDQDTRDSSLN